MTNANQTPTWFAASAVMAGGTGFERKSRLAYPRLRFIIISMNPAKIYFSRSDSAAPFLAKVVEIFEPKLRGKVLLKPNLVSHEPYPTTTDPELFRELIRLLKGRVELAVGDAAAADLLRPGKALQKHVLAKVAREQGLEFLDFYQHEMSSGELAPGARMKYSAMPGRFDLVISLPVLKTHINVLMTGALKNQFGFLDRKERGRVHFGNRGLIHQAIVGINRLARPGLFIVDFRQTLLASNEIRHGGRPARGGWMFAGEDPVALDYFGFSLLREIEPKLAGKSPAVIEYLELARQTGLGTDRFELLEV